ncbi:phosphatase PAP2 family protein [bacterium]|nr:phosphatase PAP2 family protein [bacterium]
MSIQSIVGIIVAADVAVFRFINDTLFVRWIGDVIFFIGRDQIILLVLLVAGAGYVFLTHWKKVLQVMVWAALAVVVSNFLHNHLLKLFFNRQRPFIKLSEVHLCVPLNDLSTVSLSFPSTHAASAAALAIVVMKMDSRLRWPGTVFALVIGGGTIYSGGHYPLDVLAGYIIGSVIGVLLYRISRVIWPA